MKTISITVSPKTTAHRKAADWTFIVRYDWLMLRANQTLLVSLLLLAFFVGFALWNGTQHVAFQRATLASIASAQQRTLDSLKQTVRAAETGKPFVGEYWAAPNYTYGIGSYKSNFFTTLPVAPLALIAFGNSDLMPSYYKVTIVKKQALYHTEEISSSAALYNGNFDLAFVITFLLPLLSIALTYNVVSAEKEQGTLALLLSTKTNFRRIVLSKFWFRFLLLNSAFAGLVTVGLLLSGVDVGENAGEITLLFMITLLYTAFWFGLSLFVNSRGRDSGHNAAVLVATWLLFVLLIPALLSELATSLHPAPSRVQLITKTRDISDRVEARNTQLLARYFNDHPELAPKGKAIDFNDWSIRSMRRQMELDRIVSPLEKAFTHQLANQQAVVNIYRFSSPTIIVNELLKDIAGTGQARYLNFQEQSERYYYRLQGFFRDRIFARQPFKSTDFAQIPRFEYQLQTED